MALTHAQRIETICEQFEKTDSNASLRRQLAQAQATITQLRDSLAAANDEIHMLIEQNNKFITAAEALEQECEILRGELARARQAVA